MISRSEKRRQGKFNLEQRLQAAYSKIRALELQAAALDNPDAKDPVESEVSARLLMAKPSLTKLVEAGQAQGSASISSDLRALRNFGLHADLGCGAAQLPTTAKESKSRIRGGKRLSASLPGSADSRCSSAFVSSCAHTDPGTFVDANVPFQLEHDTGIGARNSFNIHFDEALALAELTSQHSDISLGNGLAPGTWHEPTQLKTALSIDALPYVPLHLRPDHEPTANTGAAFFDIASEPDVDREGYGHAGVMGAQSVDDTPQSVGRPSPEGLGCMHQPSDSLLRTLGDQIEDLHESFANRYQSLTDSIANLGAKVDQLQGCLPDSLEQYNSQVMLKLEAVLSEVKYLLEREGLQGLPQVILDMISLLHDLLKCQTKSDACDKWEKGIQCHEILTVDASIQTLDSFPCWQVTDHSPYALEDAHAGDSAALPGVLQTWDNELRWADLYGAELDVDYSHDDDCQRGCSTHSEHALVSLRDVNEQLHSSLACVTCIPADDTVGNSSNAADDASDKGRAADTFACPSTALQHAGSCSHGHAHNESNGTPGTLGNQAGLVPGSAGQADSCPVISHECQPQQVAQKSNAYSAEVATTISDGIAGHCSLEAMKPHSGRSSVMRRFGAKWLHIATLSMFTDAAAIIKQAPTLDSLAAFLPTHEAALRQQALRYMVDDFLSYETDWTIASIILRTLIVLQLADPRTLPPELLSSLVDDILVLGKSTRAYEVQLLRCTNTLRNVLPHQPVLDQQNFSEIVPLTKKRHKKRK
eukprot:TRINITY_DN9319_c0_g1_i3.p1 TRINITY_DN9319_c0_g1~~TRINITY_DN9319_c0_g1_i3.p1  ORF type:complete len:760 (+),score=113.70 TRINITY_DN9319_c0_g1_i3:111-2390(+)